MPHASMPCSFSPPRPATALLSATLAEWRTRHPLPKATEHALALAFHSLRAHAAERARHLDHLHPSAHALDDAETALRHASLLRAALVHSTHRLILETLEARAALPLDRLLPALAVRLLRDATTAASQALEHFDPGKGGRLAGPVGLAVDRAAVRTLRDALPPRASTRAVVLQPDTLLDLPPLSPWDRSLTPDPRIARAVALGPKDDPRLSLLADRFGLGALPPRTLAQIRASRGRTAIAVARDLQRALAHCLRNNPA
jgi:hypothetical protein